MPQATGKMDKRVYLEAPVLQRNEFGEEEEVYALVAEVWAQVEPLQGRELFLAQQVSPETTHRVRIRWRPDVRSNWRVNLGGRFLYLAGPPLNPEERGEMLELTCKEAN